MQLASAPGQWLPVGKRAFVSSCCSNPFCSLATAALAHCAQRLRVAQEGRLAPLPCLLGCRTFPVLIAESFLHPAPTTIRCGPTAPPHRAALFFTECWPCWRRPLGSCRRPDGRTSCARMPEHRRARPRSSCRRGTSRPNTLIDCRSSFKRAHTQRCSPTGVMGASLRRLRLAPSSPCSRPTSFLNAKASESQTGATLR